MGMRKRITALGMATVLSISILLSGCGQDSVSDDEDITAVGEELENQETQDDIIDMSMFIAMPGKPIDDDNEIREIIAEKTGVRLHEKWMSNMQSAEEAVATLIEQDALTDLIDGADACQLLYESDMLVPWDEYLDQYPNLKNYYTPEEWEEFRQEDGHIYWANVFGNSYGEDRTTIHNEYAFWIQARVLEWAGYPKIETVDEYFDLLENYYAENKTFVNPQGKEVTIIPFTALCDDWRYYCIESAPLYIEGYPNDGWCNVNTTDYDKPTVELYQTSDTAKTFYGKLNEEYKKGIVYDDFDTQTYDQYIEMISTGALLAMTDQYWDFALNMHPSFEESGLADMGCDYVPLGLTLEKGKPQKYHTYGDSLNRYSGVCVTKICSNPEKAFEFLNSMLDGEIHDLRFWGIEDVDYLVDENGMYYRTDEMRANMKDEEYLASHMCSYSYLPQWLGTSYDGKNAMKPEEQASEFYASLSQPLEKCFKAYGAESYGDMVGSTDNCVNDFGPWYPMMVYTSGMSSMTPGSEAYSKMGKTKHEWLPQIVKASNYESAWQSYMKAFEACNPQAFIDELQQELERRIELSEQQ